MLRFSSLPESPVVQHRPTDKPDLSRREVLFGAAILAATGFSPASAAKEHVSEAELPFDAKLIYAAVNDEPFPVSAVDLKKLSPASYRQVVDYETSELPARSSSIPTTGSSTRPRKAERRCATASAWEEKDSLGRAGAISRSRRRGQIWTPPAEMIKRQPELEPYRNGMPPGPDNPLGARALYIYRNGIDTLYRLHGNGDVASIGRAVSSGCIRLIQQDTSTSMSGCLSTRRLSSHREGPLAG